MTAADTATRVLRWAAGPTGTLPTGPLWEPASLASPPAAAADAAARLARRTAALLGAGAPPFGARNRIGLGVVFLAAAIGGRQQAGAAALLARAVPIRAGGPQPDLDPWYDLVARHGLVSAALAELERPGAAALPSRPPAPGPGQRPAVAGGPADPEPEPPLAELLLDASPLTAVLHRPSQRAITSDTTGHAVNTAVALLSRPRGQRVLAHRLAACSPLTAVLTWRADLLARLRHDHQELLLDVYLVARTRFGAEWDERVAWAGWQFGALGRRGAPATLDPLALATLRFWAPLAAVERAAGPLAGLRPLLTGHDRALRLVRSFHLDLAGAA
jgi:FtsH ternary system-associated peptide